MDYGDDYWGLHRNYYRDPFPHALLCVEGEFSEGLLKAFEFQTRSPKPSIALYL